MIKFLLLVLLTLFVTIPVDATQAKIYVWHNEKGQLVYSDTPRAGAEEVSTKQGNIIKSFSSIKMQTLDIQKKEILEEYQIIIHSPKNGDTIRDNTGSVYVSASIQPVFKRGLTVQLILDDKLHQSPQTDTRFALRNIDRGEHQIKMQVLNERGKVIALSKSITFYMHRVSVN